MAMIRPEYKEFARLAREATLVPVVKSVAADFLTPVSAYLAVAEKEPNAFLLESVEGGEKIGRYTFLGARPYMRVRSRGERIVIERGAKREEREGDIFATVKELLRQHRPANVEGLPPFTAGAVGYFAYDEIGDLGRNFNRMVDQLRDSRYEIEHLHQTQMSRAEHLATLGELATGLAHEIRNPLAGIAGVIEIVARDLPATSPARAVVSDVRLEISQINRIITDLLETARPRRPEIRPGDLNVTVEHAVMLARQQVLSKPIDIQLHKSPDLPDVEHDSDQIHQVLLNLLLNAVQSIDGQGIVRVDVIARTHDVEITVADTGRGIAPEHLPNIFRPFYTTKGNGTGLGLSLARRIVEDHEGRIEVHSAIGKGTKFSVFIPYERPAA